MYMYIRPHRTPPDAIKHDMRLITVLDPMRSHRTLCVTNYTVESIPIPQGINQIIVYY